MKAAGRWEIEAKTGRLRAYRVWTSMEDLNQPQRSAYACTNFKLMGIVPRPLTLSTRYGLVRWCTLISYILGSARGRERTEPVDPWDIFAYGPLMKEDMNGCV